MLTKRKLNVLPKNVDNNLVNNTRILRVAFNEFRRELIILISNHKLVL